MKQSLENQHNDKFSYLCFVLSLIRWAVDVSLLRTACPIVSAAFRKISKKDSWFPYHRSRGDDIILNSLVWTITNTTAAAGL